MFSIDEVNASIVVFIFECYLEMTQQNLKEIPIYDREIPQN